MLGKVGFRFFSLITTFETRDFSIFFSAIGVRSSAYHAGLSPHARSKAHSDFIMDKISTIVATVAFGMGIDKRDVRTIIHYGCTGVSLHPKNFIFKNEKIFVT